MCFTNPGNYGSSHESHICGVGPLGQRTPEKVLAILRSVYLEQSLHHLSGEAKKRAASFGLTRFAVKNQLLDFDTFFGPKGVYDCMHYDDLHMMLLGLFKLILACADFLFCKYFKRTAAVQTTEDVRQLVEVLLMCIPKMNDGIHRLLLFLSGWWTMDSWNGKHLEAFFISLLFLFSTHDALIYDDGVRFEFAEIVRNTFSIFRKLKVKSTYRAEEVVVLKEQIKTLQEKMAALFSIPINSDADGRSLNEFTQINRLQPGSVPPMPDLETKKKKTR